MAFAELQKKREAFWKAKKDDEGSREEAETKEEDEGSKMKTLDDGDNEREDSCRTQAARPDYLFEAQLASAKLASILDGPHEVPYSCDDLYTRCASEAIEVFFDIVFATFHSIWNPNISFDLEAK